MATVATRHKEPAKDSHQGVILGSTVLVVLFLAVVLTFHTKIVRYVKLQFGGGPCFNLNTWVEGTINLIMHVSTFALFVCLFFFTVVHSVEKLTIYDNLQKAVTSILDDLEVAVGQPLDVSLDVQLSPALKQSDNETRQKISHLTSKAFSVFGMLMVVGLLVSGLLFVAMKAYAKKRYLCGTKTSCCELEVTQLKPGVHYPDLKQIMHHNLVVLAFVFVTECFFLFGVTLHYRSLDPNAIRQQFVGTVMELAGVTMEESGVAQSRRALEQEAQGRVPRRAAQQAAQQAARQTARQAAQQALRPRT
jgi:hypothetical protein